MNSEDLLDDQALQFLKSRIAEGDQRAFRQLFDQYAERLSRFSVSITRHKEAALEIVDEIFVKFWKQRAAVPGIRNLRTYLYTATKNASLNYLSAQAHLQLTDPFDSINIQLQEESPEQQLITAELFQRIRAAVEELPPRCRMIFKLVREDNLKYKEVAGILNLSVNTVDAQMVIAVKRISEKVKGHFDRFPKIQLKKK
ncbi:MAG: RNA polymerase sigma-70 factor [Chitinophagaceae bacterium]